MRKPDFLILGAQKAGTTWLYDMLQQHPQIQMSPVKEIFYFSDAANYERGPEWYAAHFAAAQPGRLTGEACVHYLYDTVRRNRREPAAGYPPLPELVARDLPDVKLIVCLRDPVQRALSAYYHHLRKPHYSPALSLAEVDRQHPHLLLRDFGFYARYLALWQKVFPPERFFFMLYEEDVVAHPAALWPHLFEFLEIDPAFAPAQAGWARNRRPPWLHILLLHYLGPRYKMLLKRMGHNWERRFFYLLNWLPYPPIPPADIAWLRAQYLPERPALEKMLGRALDGWTYGVK